MPPLPATGARETGGRKTARRRSEDGAAPLSRTQLAQLVNALQAARDGDFSVRLRADGTMAEVASAFNALIERNQPSGSSSRSTGSRGEFRRIGTTVNAMSERQRPPACEPSRLRAAARPHRRCDPVELAAAVVESARTHLPAAVELEFAAPSKLPQVAADAAQLQQVLANLLDNAIKYSPEGGPVRVEIENGDGGIRFTVSDSRLGIPASEHRRIFEKFYRLDPDMTLGIGGTGLGLYISRELVRRMDGEIWVESRPGRGSTFFVQLPAAGER